LTTPHAHALATHVQLAEEKRKNEQKKIDEIWKGFGEDLWGKVDIITSQV
jgi:hypothetical protein